MSHFPRLCYGDQFDWKIAVDSYLYAIATGNHFSRIRWRWRDGLLIIVQLECHVTQPIGHIAHLLSLARFRRISTPAAGARRWKTIIFILILLFERHIASTQFLFDVIDQQKRIFFLKIAIIKKEDRRIDNNFNGRISADVRAIYTLRLFRGTPCTHRSNSGKQQICYSRDDFQCRVVFSFFFRWVIPLLCPNTRWINSLNTCRKSIDTRWRAEIML